MWVISVAGGGAEGGGGGVRTPPRHVWIERLQICQDIRYYQDCPQLPVPVWIHREPDAHSREAGGEGGGGGGRVQLSVNRAWGLSVVMDAHISHVLSGY